MTAPFHFFTAAEDEGCYQCASIVGSAVLAEKAEWFTREQLEICFRANTSRWHKLSSEAPRGMRVHPVHPGRDLPDTRSFRCAILWALEGDPNAIIIASDSDGAREETAALTQACGATRAHVPVILAAAIPESEAWVLAGLEAAGMSSEELRLKFGFDPTTEPERTTSTKKNGPRDAKKILTELGGADLQARRICLGNLARLRIHGKGCGAGAFIEACESELVPLVAGR